MTALVLLSLAWSIPLQGPTNLRWPVGDGDHACALRATYGQLEGNSNSSNLHLGLDVLGTVPLETVLAIEDGVVRRVEEDNGGEYAGVLVESSARPGHGFVYKHFEKVLVSYLDTVKAGDPLGLIHHSNTATKDPHLHLSRVAGSLVKLKNHDWYDIDELAEGNPLAMLRKGADGDDLPPRVARNKYVSHVFLRPDDGESIAAVESPSGNVPIPASAPSGVGKDVIVRTFDVDRLSWHLLAPYRLRLSITTGTQTIHFRTIRLDGPLDQNNNVGLYSFSPGASSNGNTKERRYDYFIVLTNAGLEGGTENAWLATPGTHTLHVEVEDVAGNVTKIDQDVRIP